MRYELYLTAYTPDQAPELARARDAYPNVLNRSRVDRLLDCTIQPPLSIGGAVDRMHLVDVEHALVAAGVPVCIVDTGEAAGVGGFIVELASLLKATSTAPGPSARRVARGLLVDGLGVACVVGVAALLALAVDGALAPSAAPDEGRTKRAAAPALPSSAEGTSTIELEAGKPKKRREAPARERSESPGLPLAVGLVLGFGAHRVWRRRRPAAARRRRSDGALVLVGAGLAVVGIAAAASRMGTPGDAAQTPESPTLVAASAEIAASDGAGEAPPVDEPIDPTRPFQDFVERMSTTPEARCPETMKRFARLSCELFAQAPSVSAGAETPNAASAPGGGAASTPAPGQPAPAPGPDAERAAAEPADDATQPAPKTAAAARVEGVGVMPTRGAGKQARGGGGEGSGGGETTRLGGGEDKRADPSADRSRAPSKSAPRGDADSSASWVRQLGLGVAGAGLGVTMSAALGLLGLGALVVVVSLSPALAQRPSTPAAAYDPEARLQHHKAIDAAPYAEALARRFMRCLTTEGTVIAEADEAKIAESAKNLGLAMVRSDSGRGCTRDVSALSSCTERVRGLSCDSLHDEIRATLAAAFRERPAPPWADSYAEAIVGRIGACYAEETGTEMPREAQTSLEGFRSLMARSLGALQGPCTLIQGQLTVCLAIARSMTCPEIAIQLRRDPTQLIQRSMQTCGGLFDCKYDFDSWQR